MGINSIHMKPILIATDFSQAANHAADYAAQLAKACNAPLHIFHAWMIPAIGGEGFAIPFPVNDLAKEEQKAIDEEAARLEIKWGIKIKAFQATGFPTEEIETIGIKNKVGLVVMGIRHTAPVEQVFGSVVTAFITPDKCPVRIIAELAKWKVHKKILLATDLITKAGWHELDILKELAAQFNAAIHILNAMPKKLEQVSVGMNSTSHRLENLLKEYPHTWHYENDGDVTHSIYKTSDSINADWIAAIPHRMNWIQRLFNKSTTKELAFNSNIPLLILPEHHTEL